MALLTLIVLIAFRLLYDISQISVVRVDDKRKEYWGSELTDFLSKKNEVEVLIARKKRTVDPDKMYRLNLIKKSFADLSSSFDLAILSHDSIDLTYFINGTVGWLRLDTLRDYSFLYEFRTNKEIRTTIDLWHMTKIQTAIYRDANSEFPSIDPSIPANGSGLSLRNLYFIEVDGPSIHFYYINKNGYFFDYISIRIVRDNLFERDENTSRSIMNFLSFDL